MYLSVCPVIQTFRVNSLNNSMHFQGLCNVLGVIDIKVSEKLELFTENGAGFKMVRNNFNIKWCRLPVAPGL